MEELTNDRKIIYLNDYLADPTNMDKKELYIAFVGINTLEAAGYIHKDLKYKDTVDRAGRGWLLRISSKHGSSELKEICALLSVDGKQFLFTDVDGGWGDYLTMTIWGSAEV